jgi:phospholipase C
VGARGASGLAGSGDESAARLETCISRVQGSVVVAQAVRKSMTIPLRMAGSSTAHAREVKDSVAPPTQSCDNHSKETTEWGYAMTTTRPFWILAWVATVLVSAPWQRARAHGDLATPRPAYDVAADQRAQCRFGPGARTQETVGPNIPSGSQLPFKHVLVVMMENRSFDHYYSALSRPQYYGNAVDVADESFYNVDPATGARIHRFKETRYCMQDTAHSWDQVHAQWNNGKMDGFVSTSNPNGARAMGYYTDDDIPFYYWLANNFAISDRYFSPQLGSTWPNRWFFYGATSWGRIKTPDLPVMPGERKKSPTILDVLQKNGRTWRIYRDSLITWAEAAFLDITKIGHGMGRFVEDVRKDKLADVSIIDPNFIIKNFDKAGVDDNDEHPPSNIQKGQAFVAGVVRTLMSNPRVWRKSVLFITYDEHGGLYDHVPPPPACEPGGPNSSGQKFDRYGVRVPLIVVSPFAKKHYVSHHVADHTSIVRFIANRFGLGALTRRDANAWPLLDLFDFKNPPHWNPPRPPAATIDPKRDHWCRAYDPGTGGPVLSDAQLASCTQADREPNGSHLQSAKLPDLDCRSLFRKKQVLRGTLRGNADVDVYRYFGQDRILCSADPVATLNTPGVELCTFVVCKTGATQVTGCSEGTFVKGMSSGMGQGCCRDTKGSVKLKYNCKGTTDESATVFFRLKQPENRCTQYEVQYAF